MNEVSQEIVKLQKEIEEIEGKLKDSLEKVINSKEEKIIPALKQNPNLFYSYAKSFAKMTDIIGPLIENYEINSEEQMA